MNQEQSEQLPNPESMLPAENAEAVTESRLDAAAVANLFQARQQHLATLKNWVGLKFFYRAAEKIKQEETSLKHLLRLENAKQTILADYSFVLDSAYFEQKFLS